MNRGQLTAQVRQQASLLVLGTALLFLAAGSFWSHFSLGPFSMQPRMVALWMLIHATGFALLFLPRLERVFFFINFAMLQVYFHVLLFQFRLPFLAMAPVFFVTASLGLSLYVRGSWTRVAAFVPLAWLSTAYWLRSTYEDPSQFGVDAAFVISAGCHVLFFSLFFLATRHYTSRMAKGLSLLGPRSEYEEHRVHAAKLQTLGELSVSLAHEINNPVLAIGGYAHQIATELKDGHPSIEILQNASERITQNLDRVTLIVRSLRSFGRDSGRDEFAIVSLCDVIEESRLLVEHHIKSSGVELKIEIPAEDCFVNGSQTQLVQVLINLATNARDAVMGRDRKVITIGFSSRDGKVKLWVEDSGPGVPQEIAESVFKPFFTTKGAGKGTGLGLSISKRIAQRHEGKLTYQVRRDTTGRVLGTLFTLELPEYLEPAQGSEVA